MPTPLAHPSHTRFRQFFVHCPPWVRPACAVTNVAFEGFPTYEFEGGQAFLIADVSIESGTPAAATSAKLAWVAVLIYPVGIMIGNILLPFTVRRSIIDDKPTPLSRAISFLYREYDVSAFWWEVRSPPEGNVCGARSLDECTRQLTL